MHSLHGRAVVASAPALRTTEWNIVCAAAHPVARISNSRRRLQRLPRRERADFRAKVAVQGGLVFQTNHSHRRLITAPSVTAACSPEGPFCLGILPLVDEASPDRELLNACAQAMRMTFLHCLSEWRKPERSNE
ncbi:MAG: hypothetical protein DWI10_08370 [Planctomycetota bacterium]|nr:MAG: hypothetical protein DWI10_08370 [Planctomycetota bacterium]